MGVNRIEKVSANVRASIFELAEQSVKNHNRNGRSRDETVFHIVVGKIGEFCFLKQFLHRETDEKLFTINEKTDDGWDFDVNGVKIDVKASNHPNARKMFVRPNALNSDVYVFFKIFGAYPILDMGLFYGWLTKDEVKKKLGNNNFICLSDMNKSEEELIEFLKV